MTPRRSQQGVALVVTLILLSVIAFLAITFLVISQRERGSVSVTASQTDARFAADAALERAKAEIIATMLAFTNEFAFDLLVSTNFINTNGFNAAQPNNIVWPTNVNYDHLYGNPNAPLNPFQQQQNQLNLLYNPRVPVFITNRLTGSNEFQYYLDLNRNRRFEPTGLLAETNDLNQPTGFAGLYTGDPQWIGGLERPDFPHSPTNRFMHRYAYFVVPIGKALDLNAIHNQAFTKTLNPADDGFLRNQGVAPWEINLAAFLRDLNTNVWGYAYDRPAGARNTGFAFEDAFSLLRFRYGGNYNSLRSVSTLFGAAGATAFANDRIDGYSDGPLMLGPGLTNDLDQINLPWPGADNTNHFFTTQDLFDPNKTSAFFTNRLLSLGSSNSTYNRYSFYRMAPQLGTDSAPDPPDKINLNYVNVGGVRATNFMHWQPHQFFTTVADRLLRTTYRGTGLSLTNIALWPTNDYSPNVHRLLQLAANLHDATTNRLETAYPHLPSVFRPVFRNDGGNISIAGYVEETDATILSRPFRDLNDPSDRSALQPDDNVYGVPLVIGAKKGFPNFNEFAMQTVVQVGRKLELRKNSAAERFPNETNQMYTIGISNTFGVEFWNSYSATFPRSLGLLVSNQVSIALSNEFTTLRTNFYALSHNTNLPANTWRGFVNVQFPQQSFHLPFGSGTNLLFLPDAIYSPTPPYFKAVTAGFDRNTGFPIPRWWLHVKHRLTCMMVDTSVTPPRIVDFVNLSGLETSVDITQELLGNIGTDPRLTSGLLASLWNTNRPGGSLSPNVPTYGVIKQIQVSQGSDPVSSTEWNNYGGLGSKDWEIDKFRVFMGLSPLRYRTDQITRTNRAQAPFSPSRKLYQRISWQANDPLVHYLASDLSDLARTNEVNVLHSANAVLPPMTSLGSINSRYEPWTDTLPGRSSTPTRFDLTVKDPLVGRSDDWDFPTNKLPNIGWIGRVHRGTPWQTVYLKSVAPFTRDDKLWKEWTGNAFDNDAKRAQPESDWALLDLFTTAPNENASRGQLSANQTNLAALSAVLSGVITLTNPVPDLDVSMMSLTNGRPAFAPLVIEPAGADTNSPLLRIVNAINDVRATNYAGTFTNLGNLLSVPELTVNSPFLSLTAVQREKGLSDAVYERIPQQILSLLHLDHTPRFVVYAYGQSLKPADKSIVLGGPFRGLCTNYQITAEVATRSVVSVEGSPDPREANNPDPRRRYPPRVLVESFNLLPPD